MGISLEASEARAFPSRPRYFDTLEAYEAADGQVLYGVFLRKKRVPYALVRYVFKVLRFFVEDIENPTPYEIAGFWDDEVMAEEHCRQIAERHGGKVAVMYGPVYVNRAFPDKIVTWRGAVKPGAVFGRRRKSAARAPLYVMVEEADYNSKLTELEDWRSGRKETDANASLRRLLLAVADLDRRLRAVECCRGERGRVATGSGTT